MKATNWQTAYIKKGTARHEGIVGVSSASTKEGTHITLIETGGTSKLLEIKLNRAEAKIVAEQLLASLENNLDKE